jgi:hypothetical protein
MPTTRTDMKLYLWAYKQSGKRARLSDSQISKLEAISPDFFTPRTGPALSHRPISTAAELLPGRAGGLSIIGLLLKTNTRPN